MIEHVTQRLRLAIPVCEVGPDTQFRITAIVFNDPDDDLLKLFPVSTIGPDHVSAIWGPLGDIPVVSTGGVTAANVASYFEAGAVAVGAGSGIVDHDAIADGDMDGVRQKAAVFPAAVDDIRSV